MKIETIHEKFEHQVSLTPDRTAVYYMGETLTYSQLNEKANRGAHNLIKRGAGPETIVGLYHKMSSDLIISLFAVLKAGCAYLPMDIATPARRVKTMLDDSKAAFLITDKEELELPDNELEIMPADFFTGKKENPRVQCTGENLAYVIYTSGSTGKPKGVMIEHRSVLNLTNWFAKEMDFTAHPRMLQMTKICFDVSVDEILSTLLNGASLYIPPAELRLNKAGLTDFIKTHKINIAEFVPSLLQDYIVDNEKMTDLKVVISGAERIQPALRDRVLDKGYTLYNLYGPTETTVTSVFKKCDKENDVIGTPIDNTEIYILDKENRQLGQGEPGELVIAGQGLARGYLFDRDLTERKFVNNPFKAGTRMYKTGDLARWNEEGNLEFLGRIDNQVKIRGYRVEPGEIEARFLEHEAVKEACVVVKKDNLNNNTLAAFVCLKPGSELNDLKNYLAKTLPDYMVPPVITILDSIKLTKNGKYDRNFLKEYKTEPEEKGITLPANKTEQVLLELLTKILGTETLCTKSSFQEQGANSIHMIKLADSINKVFKQKVNVLHVIKHTSIQSLGAYLGEIIKERG